MELASRRILFTACSEHPGGAWAAQQARNLEYVLKEFVEHYQAARPHQGLDQRTPSGLPAATPLAVGRIVRQDRLGGLIHEYDRAAA